MRVAVLIIGLVLSFGLFWQSVLITGLSGVASDEKTQGAGAIGVLMGMLWLVACGFVLPKPRISMVIFGISALLGLAGMAEFPDLKVWSVLAVALAALSYLGYRGKIKQETKDAARDALLQQAVVTMGQSAMAVTAPNIVAAVQCPNCGSVERSGARYCGSCGTVLPVS